MAEPDSNPDAKLEKLAELVRRGWAKLHPITPAQRAAVERTVRQEWDREQKQERAPGETLDPAQEQKKKAEQERSKQQGGKGQDSGQSR